MVCIKALWSNRQTLVNAFKGDGSIYLILMFKHSLSTKRAHLYQHKIRIINLRVPSFFAIKIDREDSRGAEAQLPPVNRTVGGFDSQRGDRKFLL